MENNAKLWVLHFSYNTLLGREEEIAGIFSSKHLAENAAIELETKFRTTDELGYSILEFELDNCKFLYKNLTGET